MDILGYTEDGSIEVIIDGKTAFVPDDASNRHRQMIATWEEEGNTIPPYNPTPKTLADAIATKLAALDLYRWKQEVGGVQFGGATIRTDANSQAKIAAAYFSAKADPAYVIPTWEVTPGVFTALDNSSLVAMGEAVRAHIQDTFNRKAVLHGQIVTLATIEQVQAFEIATEWAALAPN